MSKYKKRLVQEVIDKKAFEAKQEQLKEKYQVAEENKIIVEKSNMIKFLIRTAGAVVRVCAGGAVLILAAVGILALIYPGPRREMLLIGQEILEELLVFIS
ncbi:hypothetical protein [uncultured Merdimonas sp.]|uniref:hypothetical protein n=1 Tax=uncultured Merdimonas sp. TaxID=2023269 RepID=UPI0032098E70